MPLLFTHLRLHTLPWLDQAGLGSRLAERLEDPLPSCCYIIFLQQVLQKTFPRAFLGLGSGGQCERVSSQSGELGDQRP